MLEPDFPDTEAGRVQAVCGLRILDTLPEDRFDRITRLAANFFSVPTAAFTIVDVNRQWFKSRYGLEMSETPRRISFCGHVINMQDTLIVKDALTDARFYDNPLVTAGPKIRFYAGHPVYSADGFAIGSLCLIDTEPRFFSQSDVRSLVDFAKLLEIELQNRSMELAAVSQSKVLDSTVQKLVKHIDNSPLAVLEWDRFLRVSKWSRQAEDIFGWHADEVIGKTLLEWQFIHEDDVARVTSSLDAMIQCKEPSVIIHNKNYKKDGSVADCFWYNSILFDENGEILSVLSLVQDETARVTAESQLLQANQVLELRVKQRTAELEQKQAMLNVILDTINVGIVAADASGKLTLFNRATKKLHGIDNLNVSQDEWAKYYKLLELDGSKVLNTSDVPLSRALRGELVDHQQFVIESVNGLQRIISASGQSFSDSHGNPLGAVVAMHDITDEKKIELELIAKQALLRSITDSIPVGVAYVDKHQRYQYCNPQYQRIYNRDITAIVGNTKREVFGEAIYKTLESFIQAALMGEMVAIERQQTINDHVIYLDVRFIPDKSVTGEVIGFYVMVWDVTDQKRREMEFQRQASIDPLTGVYNKSFITELLKQEIKKQQETRKNIAIMFLDIDYFKKINDQYGHLIGDEVIKFFAAQVRASIRKIDYIGRFGGDEFLLVISDINSLASAERIADKILASVATPFKVGALTLQLSTSVGIAFSKNSASGNLVKLADEALYEAKAAGRGNFKSKELS